MPHKQDPAEVTAKKLVEHAKTHYADRDGPAPGNQKDPYIFLQFKNVNRFKKWALRLSPIPESGEFQEYWDSLLAVYDVIQFIGRCLSLIPDYRSDVARLHENPGFFEDFRKKWGAVPHPAYDKLHCVIVPGFELGDTDEDSDYPSMSINPNLPERLLTGHVRRERSRNARAAFKPAPREWERDLALYEQYKNNQLTQAQVMDWWNDRLKSLNKDNPNWINEDDSDWIRTVDVVRKALSQARSWVEKECYRDYLPNQ